MPDAVESEQVIEHRSWLVTEGGSMVRTEEALGGVLDALPAFVGVLAIDGTVTRVNRAALQAAALSPSQAVGRKLWDCYWWSHSPEAQAYLRRAVERVAVGETVRQDLVMRAAGEARRWVDFQLAPLRGDDASIRGSAFSAIDITERVSAQDSLRASDDRLRFVTESAEVGYWHWDIVHDRLDWSPLCRRLFGIEPAEEISYGRFLEAVDAEDRERIRAAVRGCVEGGGKRDYDVDFRTRLPDGTIRWIHAKGSVVSEHGRPVLMAGIALDITDRKRAENLLAEHTALLEAIATKAPIGLAFVDRNCRYRRVNEMLARMNGVPVEAHIGRTVPEVVPHVWPKVEAFYVQALSGHPVANMEVEVECPRAAGRTEHWLVSYYPVRVEAEIVGVGAVLVDITTQKRTEALLKEADRRKDQFLATLAHELRTPLAPIRNAVQILNLQAPRDSTAQAARDIIERQLQQMVRLVDDLLDVNRISRGKLELRRQRTTLNAVMEQALEASSPHIERSGHELSASWPAELIQLHADAVRLAQVFSNLLNNACKYTPRGGRIWLTASRQGGEAVVSVRDSGTGIAAESLDRVFEMFSQLAPTLDGSQDGLGIGLSLARGLVEMHGGSIEARSEGIGKGSEFVVRLPIAGEDAATMNGLSDECVDRVGQPLHRILVVDDNRDSAQSLATLLQMLGNDVETAYDGVEALQTAEAWRPEVILLDIGMPRMNGYDACRAIRERPWGADVVVIALTGFGQDEDRRRSREAGFDGHLVKPVDDTALMAQLRSMRPRKGEAATIAPPVGGSLG
jgi:PAS domain S-box-containing protein